MICVVYERRPKTLRTISDPRAAKPIAQIEIDDQGRHHENVSLIKEKLNELGYKIACPPSKTTTPDVDFVAYTEPSPMTSPREAAEDLKKITTKKKPVSVGSNSGVKRRLPLPQNRRRR